MTDVFWRGSPGLNIDNHWLAPWKLWFLCQVKRWNFRKANWKKYCDITNQLAKDLPSPNTSYVDKADQDFCNSIITAAKIAIPSGRKNKYKLCWDAECEDLYQAFNRAPRGETSDTGTTATALLARFDEKRKSRWSEDVKSIDFTYSSRLAWTTINYLTDRFRNLHRPCPCHLHWITTREEWDIQDQGPRVRQTCYQRGIWPLEDSNPRRQVHFWRVHFRWIYPYPPATKTRESPRSRLQMPRSTSWTPAVPSSLGCTNFYPPASNISSSQKSGEEQQ